MSSADKLMAVLPLFTPESPEWSIDAAAEVLQVSESTAYRYFTSLCAAGLLDPVSGGRYVLGPAFIAYDRTIRIQDRLLQAARPVMERLVQRNGGHGVALLCRRFRQQVMCIDQAFEHKPDYAVSYERGRPMGLYRGASSLVILCNLPSRTLRNLWKTDAAEIEAAELGGSWEAFKKTLRTLRAQQGIITYGQLDKGMIGISAPIFHADRSIAGSISMVIPQDTATPGGIQGILVTVRAAALEIDHDLQAVPAS